MKNKNINQQTQQQQIEQSNRQQQTQQQQINQIVVIKISTYKKLN